MESVELLDINWTLPLHPIHSAPLPSKQTSTVVHGHVSLPKHPNQKHNNIKVLQQGGELPMLFQHSVKLMHFILFSATWFQ